MSPTSPRTMNKPRWRALTVVAVLLFAIVSPANVSAHARGHHQHSAASVISWNETASTAYTASKFPPPVFAVGMAYVQAAVYNAVVGVKGGYEQYKWHARAHRGTSVDAAVAAAAHRMLLTYVPDATALANVEAAYTAALNAIPDGWSKDAGILFGERAAARILKLRAGDGFMDPTIVFSEPATPGVWRSTVVPAAPFAAVWAGEMRPFLLRRHDQFRPSGPPSLTSAQYAADVNEGEEIGSASSTTRTPEQTEIAHLFGDALNVFPAQLQWAFRDHLTRHPGGIVRAARYFAAADLSAADAVIASWDAKFVYSSWRPISAIQMADTDDNPATTADPNWAPLIATPQHPDYLSGHTTVSGAVTRALTRLSGTSRIDLNIPWLPAAPAPVVKWQHYEWAGQFNLSSIGARIWAGIHTRTADEVGNAVGKKVGDFGARHYFHATH